MALQERLFPTKIAIKNEPADTYQSLFQNAFLSADATITIANFATQTLASVNNAQTFSANQYCSSQWLGKDGSKTSPSYSFNSDTDTGIFWKSSGSVGFSANNTEIGSWSETTWIFGLDATAATAPRVIINTGTSGSMSGYDKVASGQIAFTNASAAAPAPSIIARTDSNRPGLGFVSYTPDGNTLGDITWETLDNTAGGAHSTPTRNAYVWYADGVQVLAITRAGDIVICPTANTKLTDLRLPTQTTVGAAGGASALPATPTGYVETKIQGTSYIIPYYAKS